MPSATQQGREKRWHCSHSTDTETLTKGEGVHPWLLRAEKDLELGLVMPSSMLYLLYHMTLVVSSNCNITRKNLFVPSGHVIILELKRHPVIGSYIPRQTRAFLPRRPALSVS